MTFSFVDHFNVRDVTVVTTHSVADNYNVDAPSGTLPGAPTDFTITPLDGGALITWTAPAEQGTPILGFVAVATMVGGGSLHFTIPPTFTSAILGLTNAETWSVFLYAMVYAGGGTPTDPLSVAPTTSDDPFNPLDALVIHPDEEVPDPPVLTSLTASDGAIGAYWDEPTFTGNSPITEYDVFATTAEDGVVVTYTVPVFSGVLTGALIGPLTNDVEYTVFVRARNIVGSSVDSNSLTGTPEAGLPPILDIPGYVQPLPPAPYREPDPIYWAFPMRHYFNPGNWGLTDTEAAVRENA